MVEERPVPGFANRYTVTSRGELKGPKGTVTQSRNPKGYLRVWLRGEEGLRVQQYVHRIVLDAFQGPPLEGQNQCRHLNGNPGDNRVENLAWGSARDNAVDRKLHGRDRVRRSPPTGGFLECRNGHTLNEDNAYVRKRTGYISCRVCNKLRMRGVNRG